MLRGPAGGVSTRTVLAGDVSTGDVSTGDVSTGDVSTGDVLAAFVGRIARGRGLRAQRRFRLTGRVRHAPPPRRASTSNSTVTSRAT